MRDDEPNTGSELREELRALGYLEGRLDRFLERGGPGIEWCLVAALRLAGVAGPLLALILLGFHAVANPLLAASGSRALALFGIVLVGELGLVATVAFVVNVAARRGLSARHRPGKGTAPRHPDGL